MDKILLNIYSSARESENYGEKFFISLGIFLATILLYRLFVWVTRKVTDREHISFTLKKAVKYLIVLAGMVGIFITWFNALEGLVAALTIVFFLLAFAMKDLVLNFAAFFYIYVRHPFGVGDRIQIGEVIGDVIDVEPFQISMAEVGHWLESQNHTGRRVYISNQEIFNKTFYNFSGEFPYLWRDILVPITHESAVEDMIEFLQHVGEEMMTRLIGEAYRGENEEGLEEMITQVQLFNGDILPKVHMRVHGSGIDCYLKFLCPYDGIVTYETVLWRRIVGFVNSREDIQWSPTVYRIIHSDPVNEYQ